MGKLQAACFGATLAGLVAGSASAQLFSAVLPQARSGVPNQARTVFATMINAGSVQLNNCHPQLTASMTGLMTLSYQTTNASNALTGAPDIAAKIAAGGQQSFLLSFTPNSPGAGVVGLEMACDAPDGNGQVKAPISTAVNDFTLQTETAQGPDIIPIALTPSNDGIVKIAAVGGAQAMATAAVNIGATQLITVTPGPARSGTNMAASLSVAETDVNGVPLATPTSSVTVNFVQNQPRYFAVFVQANPGAGLPLQPDTLRVVLRFTGQDGKLRGQTSAALQAPAPASNSPQGLFEGVTRLPDGSSFVAEILRLSAARSVYFTQLYGTSTTSVTGWTQIVIPYENMVQTGSTLTASAPVTYINLSGAQQNGSVQWTGSFAPLTSLENSAFNLDGTPQARTTANYSGLNFLTTSLAAIAGVHPIQRTRTAAAAQVNAGSMTISTSGALSGTFVAADQTTTCTIAGQLSDNDGLPNVLLIDNLILKGPDACAFNATGYVIRRGTVQMLPSQIGGTAGDYYELIIVDPTRPAGGDILLLR